MKRSANYVTDLNCELLKPREYKLKKNTDTSEYAEVTPLYEKKLCDKSRMEHYSFVNNENLHCLWQKKINWIGVKRDVQIKRRRQLPDFTRLSIRVDDSLDYHFHNQASKLLPSQSLRNRPPAHFILAPGPGIDKYGDKPIPDDMMRNRYQRHNKSAESSAALKKA